MLLHYYNQLLTSWQFRRCNAISIPGLRYCLHHLQLLDNKGLCNNDIDVMITYLESSVNVGVMAVSNCVLCMMAMSRSSGWNLRSL